MKKRSWIPAAFLIACLIADPTPGVTTDESAAYKGWEVAKVEIDGIDESLASRLKKGLALAITKGLRTRGAEFFPNTLEEDIRRSELFLARNGYPYARVTARIEPDARRRRVEVLFLVESGPAVRVNSIVLTGFPRPLIRRADELAINNMGQIFTDRDAATSIEALSSFLRGEGYARARVEAEVAWLDTVSVTVEFVADTVAVYYFRDVIVKGSPDDLVPLVKKTVNIKPGRRYSPKTMDDTRDNLRLLALFQRIGLDIEDVARDSVDLVVDLIPRNPRTIDAALRYWTDDRVDGGVRWIHRNLFGRGRGGSALISASQFLQQARVAAWWPALLAPNTRTTISLKVEREDEEAYETVASGTDLFVDYNFSFATTYRLGLEVSNLVITEKTDVPTEIEDSDGVLTALSFRWDREATDNILVPTRGVRTGFDIEWAPDFSRADHHYIKGGLGGSIYVPFAPKTQAAFRLVCGVGKPLGASTGIIPNKRYYSGGAATHRGFHRRKLGPLDRSGAPLGGEALLESSFEIRYPLPWKFRGTAFIDAGQVWLTKDDIRWDNIEVAIGPGLWLETIVGPFRADLGYRITRHENSHPTGGPVDGLPRVVFHFSIGPAF